MTSEYGKRVIELFESGKATKAQKAELVEAVLSAAEHGTENVTAIHMAIGFEAAQKVLDNAEDARFLSEGAATDAAALTACGSEEERMQMIRTNIYATHRKAEQAGNRAWRAAAKAAIECA